MGKEWYYWGGGKSSKKGGGGGEGGREKEKDSANLGCMCAVFQLFDFHQFQLPLNHPQQSSNFLQPNSFLRLEDPTIPKGFEAPRNSLELEEEPSLASSKDENFNIPMGIQIKTKGVPNTDSSSSEISSSPGTKTPNLVARLMGLDLLPDHLTSSPSHSTLGTPNLPPKSHFQHQRCRHQQPPHHSKRSSPRSRTLDHDFSGTRSLPETPRISSARRSDVEHRLSLQINKENVGEDLVLSRFSSLKRKELKVEDENRSPGRYARQIAKQVKESVGRKVGLDITNTVRNREQTRRRDQELELVSQYKSKKILSKALSTTKIVDVSANSPGKHSVTTTSCSPRLKFLEPKNKPITTLPCKDRNNISHSHKPPPPLLSQNTKPSTNPNLLHQVLQDQYQHQHRHQQRPFKKCKKVTEEKFGPPPSRIIKKPPKKSYIIRTKQEEPFVRSTSASITNIPDKKCKKTPLSNDLNISLPILLPVKKDPTPPATKIPQKQVSNAAQESKWSSQLSSCSSQSYKQPQAMPRLDARENNNEDRSNNGVAANTITTGDGAANEEYEYLTRILKRTGIDKDTPVSFTRWFSPSHPLDPSTFYYLEHFTTPAGSITTYQNRTLDRRCNRKLLFNLVDEILVSILRPYINMKPWSSSTRFGLVPQYDRISQKNGSHLVQMLCTKIRSFPCVDCHDLEDIDGLIDKDLPQLMKDQSEVAFGEEGEEIVMEIEKEIVDTLIHETALIFYGD